MKAALEIGRWVFLAPIGYLNAPRATGKSLMQESRTRAARPPAFEEYATGRFTKQQVLDRRASGGSRTVGKPLTSQAIGDVAAQSASTPASSTSPDYGVRGRRGDFEPLVSEELFYRVQAVLIGASSEHHAKAASAP